MSVLTLTRSRIRSGFYEGLLTTRAKLKSAPVLELRLLDVTLGNLELIPDLIEFTFITAPSISYPNESRISSNR